MDSINANQPEENRKDLDGADASRQQGVFRVLYRHIETEATPPDVIGIRLYVEHENDAARKTYAELGMEEELYLMMARYPAYRRTSAISG